MKTLSLLRPIPEPQQDRTHHIYLQCIMEDTDVVQVEGQAQESWRPDTQLPERSTYFLVRRTPIDIRSAYFSVEAGRWDSYCGGGRFEWTEIPR